MKGPEKLKRCSIFSIAGRQNSREKKYSQRREREKERGEKEKK
jgi:hypothetical protein